MKCENDLRALLRRFVATGESKLDEAAVECGVSVFRVFYTTYRVWLIDQVDEDFASDVVRIVIDLTFALARNPFWAAHAGHLNPILANAVQTWMVSAQYLDKAMNDDQSLSPDVLAHYRTQALATQSAFIDLMAAILSLSMPDYLDRATVVRDALVEFKDKYLFAA